MKQTLAPRKLALSAAVAAAYAALTILLTPISYGAVQFRLSEVLCVLPFFFPCTAQGLFLGCIIANLPTGNVFDIVFGSLATLLAGFCTAAFGRRSPTLGNQIKACLMPVLFNAAIVGAVLTWAYEFFLVPGHPFLSYLANAGCVGFGELAVLLVLGLPLIRWLPRQKYFREQMIKFQ